MHGSDFSDRTLYINFLGQIGSLSLKRIIERMPRDYDGRSPPEQVSAPLKLFKSAFWQEVSRTWDCGVRFRLSTVAKATNRTSKYWTGYFQRNPKDLCWVLFPINDLVKQDQLVRGIFLKASQVLQLEIATGRELRSREARMLARFLELIFSRV